MPTSPVHTSSSQPRPASPVDDTRTPGSDGSEDQVTDAVYKRLYLKLKDSMNTEKSLKRKSRNTTSTTRLGRGIRKVIFVCGEIRDLVSDSDKHCAYLLDPEGLDLNSELDGLDEDGVESMKRDWERSYTAVRELMCLIPNFRKTIDERSPEELSEFYAALQVGANGARSDDLCRICACIVDWLNSANPTPSPLFDPSCCQNRGIAHDTTGRLLCPAEFNWDSLVTRAKLRALDEEFDWSSSYHSRCFYAKYKPDVNNLENGYLKSTLLIKVYKAIFTSPSSAKDFLDEENGAENLPPAKSRKTSSNTRVRRNVASKVRLNEKVTPRSIAYAAVQLHFNLQTGATWTPVFEGFNYVGLYNYVVDFFEDIPGPAAKERTQELLNWWTTKIFPAAIRHRQSNTSSSRKALKEQCMALERQAAD